MKLMSDGGMPLAINTGKSTSGKMTDLQRKMYEDADKALQKAEDEWRAAGSPWTDDQEAFLNRMTGV
ncbi:MAG: hypothetical protein IPH35_04975 [Rhodoferax sp.]|nr:hypothetical protein [Rhodoferax sp.]